MKKKLIAVFCGSLFLISGCSDATTQISDANKVLITIDGEEIDKGDIYDGLIAQGNITPIETKMDEILVDKLVPVDDKISEEAQKTLDGYKTSYGDDWEKTYQDAGYKTEKDFFNDVVLLNTRISKLVELYVNADFKALAKEYNPRKAEIIQVKDMETAQKVLSEAKKKGSKFNDLATASGDVTTYDGTAKVYNSKSGLPDVVWNNIVGTEKSGTVIDKVLQDTTSGTYFIVRVSEVNPNKFKKEAVASIQSIQVDTTADAQGNTPLSLSDQAFEYYLHKYDYSIHDIDIYQALLSKSQKFER